MQRFRMNRGVSVREMSPCSYELVRYDAYTEEIGALNLPPNPNEQDLVFWPAPSTGLHYFRGGYEHLVDDDVKACLIASDIGITDDNFTIPSGFGSGGFGEGPFGGPPVFGG
jgi:hypothetical protein